MEAWDNGDNTPQENFRAAQIQGISRRMMGMVRSISKLPTYRRRLRNEDEVIYGKRKRLKPGNVSPRRLVPAHITKPPYVGSFTVPEVSSGLQIHDKKGIESMRASGRLATRVRDMLDPSYSQMSEPFVFFQEMVKIILIGFALAFLIALPL